MNCAGSDLSHKMAENKVRILIAEDDLTARTILAGVLKKLGYEVTALKDGLAAWEILQQPDCPRLAVLDWMMPGLDGLEVIRRVRAQDAEQPHYIILLTSKDQVEDITAGLETGANDYVRKPFDNAELSARIRVGLRTLELQSRLFEMQQNLAHLAAHDPLTGILNRRAILDRLAQELARSRREGNNSLQNGLWIAYFDLDHFKQVNDRCGHQCGDEILKAVCETVTSHLRPYDSFGRMGGDEFLVVLPVSLTADGSVETACAVFTRIASAIADIRLRCAAIDASVTASIGVAMADASEPLDRLLERADAAMYRAKREGGNRVLAAEEGE